MGREVHQRLDGKVTADSQNGEMARGRLCRSTPTPRLPGRFGGRGLARRPAHRGCPSPPRGVHGKAGRAPPRRPWTASGLTCDLEIEYGRLHRAHQFPRRRFSRVTTRLFHGLRCICPLPFGVGGPHILARPAGTQRLLLSGRSRWATSTPAHGVFAVRHLGQAPALTDQGAQGLSAAE